MANIGSESVEVVPDARGFVEKLRAQLANLPTIDIKVDSAEAMAKIAELRAQLDELRDRRVDVHVDDNGSAASTRARVASIGDGAGGVNLKVASIGVALLALIPIAAAASIAVAGIGAGIGIGVLGGLVGALALGGVGKALSASNTPTGGGGGGQSQAQALNSQRQAEVALTVAQRNAVDAQRALTQARVDAVQTLQDLSNQVTDNGLAQRQAVLDLQTAQRNLQVAQANPDAQNPANAGALAQVQLAADQAKQNLTELQEKGTQLAAQQTAAVAAGVDGSAKVVQAQNAVTDSQNALVEAQFNTQKSASAAGGGLTAYQSAMAKLDPVQQNFVRFIQSIKPAFDGIKNAAADSFLPKLQVAITALLPLLPRITGIVSTIGSAFGDLAIKASQALTGPFWTQFLTFVQTNIGPAIDTFGRIFGGLFQLAAGFFQQAYPLIKEFGDAIAGALGSANGGVQGGALGGFFAFIQESAPQLKQTLKDVAGSIASIFKSLAPSAGPALQVISELSKDLAALFVVLGPVIRVLVPFAPLILGIVLAIKAWIVVQGVLDVLLDANPIGLVALAIAALTIEIIYLVTHWQQFVDFLNGPWGTAVSAAIAVFLPFIGIPLLVIGHWDQLREFFKGLWADIKDAFTDGKNWISARIDDVINIFAALPGRFAGLFAGTFDGLKNAFKDAINWIIAKWNAIKFTTPNVPGTDFGGVTIGTPHIDPIKFSHGGPVVGSGSGTSDSVLAALSNGEFVVNANATAQHLPELTAWNNGQQAKSGGSPINVYPAAGMDEVALAMAVNRRLQFA